MRLVTRLAKEHPARLNPNFSKQRSLLTKPEENTRRSFLRGGSRESRVGKNAPRLPPPFKVSWKLFCGARRYSTTEKTGLIVKGVRRVVGRSLGEELIKFREKKSRWTPITSAEIFEYILPGKWRFQMRHDLLHESFIYELGIRVVGQLVNNVSAS